MASAESLERKALLDVAVEAACAAAAIVRSRAGDAATLHWQIKSPADFVTEVDTAAEHAIRDVILSRRPDAEVLGEELSPSAVARGTTFIVDPLDGTTNFLHGFPVYAVSIGVVQDGHLSAGVVVDVVRDVRYTAVRDAGAWRDGERIHVSGTSEPSRALIGTGFPFKHLAHLEAYQRQFAAIVRTTSGVRRPGSAALDLAAVASGWFDGFWELSLAPWDVAAGVLLVREAGGLVTDLQGRDVTGLSHGPLVAASRALHPWLLTTIQRA
ncbi:MAG TPA: inositol monophosphatase family protein [Gemmatimonadaceae bacterium]|nr:inositol monophosphatase family protein [Gemmatimonadaceae bacterium]